ncbi:DVU_1556 family methyltransferase [Pseudodesulfovibrio sp. JC047]|uniref:DVU_1556 family methyltransferase n=1 Tax=Pseudodesulfovibrio sp. JC047 TaxID=2683199 RepID=UPI0031BA6C45
MTPSTTEIPLWEHPVLRAAAGETLRPGGFAITDRAAALIGLVPGWRVLDVGSGLGVTVDRLRARFGVESWGVELSGSQIARGDARHVIQARGDVLPFADGTFDAVFCECVLSLFENPRQGLAEFHRVIRPQGVVVLADLYAEGRIESSGNSCGERAVSLATTRTQIEACGFSVRLVEDHTDQLKNLAAKLVFAGDHRAGGCGCGLGYYLMIAQKEGEPHGG